MADDRLETRRMAHLLLTILKQSVVDGSEDGIIADYAVAYTCLITDGAFDPRERLPRLTPGEALETHVSDAVDSGQMKASAAARFRMAVNAGAPEVAHSVIDRELAAGGIHATMVDDLRAALGSRQ